MLRTGSALALAVTVGALGQTSAQLDPPAAGDGSLVSLGPRPEFLVRDMAPGPLKEALLACLDEPPRRTDFSIGHRGAPLQFPEHTLESYQAAYRMGAGMLECDVTFTRDKALVCRHSQDDLATSTNILLTPLAERCTAAFEPAVLDAAGQVVTPARAECRTSDLTLAEFKTLRGKMDAFDPAASTPQEFVGGTAGFRTDLYAGPTSGTLMTHAESIALFQSLGVKMTPELKAPAVTMPFDGFGQQEFAQKLIDEYRAAGVAADRVFAQSFDIGDISYWLDHEPDFGRQAVYLEDANSPSELPALPELAAYKARGINIVAPPIFALLEVDDLGQIVPSAYARNLQTAGLASIAWTFERSGVLTRAGDDFYLQTIADSIERDGDVFAVMDVLVRQAGIVGAFSDWPATTSYYASCMGLD